MKYLLLLLLCVSSVLAGTPPVPPPPYGGSDIRDTTITNTKIKATGQTTGKTLLSNGGDYPVWGFPASNLSNATVNGDLFIFGHNRTINQATLFDTSRVRCYNVSSPLAIKYPDSLKALGCNDSLTAFHPNAKYFPGGLFGYTMFLTVTASSNPNCDEDMFLRVSNDGENWVKLPGCPDPLSFATTFTIDDTMALIPGGHLPSSWMGKASKYNSDNDILFGSDGKLWIIVRATWAAWIASHYSDTSSAGYPPDTSVSALYVRSTSDGTTWSSWKRITPFRIGGSGNGLAKGNSTFMSPAGWVDSVGRYKLMVINEGGAGGGVDAVNRVELWSATYIDSAYGTTGGWTIVDTVNEAGRTGTKLRFPCGVSTSATTDDSITWKGGGYWPWHIGVVDNGPDQQIILLTMKNKGTPNDSAGSFVLFMGVSENGKEIQVRQTPILKPSRTVGAFDSLFVYKASGWVEDRGAAKSIRLFYEGAYGTAAEKAKVGQTWLAFPEQLDSLNEPNSVGNYKHFVWPTEYLTGQLYNKAAVTTADSIFLFLPQMRGIGETGYTYQWDFIDSSGDASAMADVFRVGGYVPYDFASDSIVIEYKVTGTGTAIDSVNWGYMNGFATAISTSTVDTITSSYTTDLTDVNGARYAIAFSKNWVAGQFWFMTIGTKFNAGANGCVRGQVALRGKRR